MSARLLTAVLIAAIILPAAALAISPGDVMSFDSVTIIRVAPETMHIGEKTPVSLVFENTGTSEKRVEFQEWLPDSADFDREAATRTVSVHTGEGWYCPDGQCTGSVSSLSSYTTTSYSYDWSIRLLPKERTVVSYWLVPKNPGDFSILPTAVMINGKEYWFHGKIIEVSCNADRRCDTAGGENYLNCPQDCAAWDRDTICNAVKDGNCDPDCISGADPDCTGLNAYIPAIVIIVLAGGIVTAVYLKRKAVKKK